MLRKFIKATTWVMVSNMGSKLINFITLGFLARVLGPGQLGFYNAVQNSGNYLNMMSSLGSSIVIQRVGARLKELGNTTVSEMFSNSFTLYLIINILLAIGIAIFPAYFFDLLLDQKGNVNYVYLISILTVLNAIVQVPVYLMLGLEEFKQYAVRSLLTALVTLIMSVILVVFLHRNIFAVYLALILSMLINVLLTGAVFYKIIHKYNLQLRLAFKWKIIKEVISNGFIYYFGNTFLGAIVGMVTISLFYKNLTPEDYGYTRIGNAISILLSVIPAAVQPVTISLLSGKFLAGHRIKSVQTRIIPFLSTLLFVTIVLNLDFILLLGFGKQYLGANQIVFGMTLVQIPYIYLGLINNYQVGEGNLNFVGWVATVGCLIMISSSIYLIPRFGLKGYFGAMYISTFVGLAIMMYKEYFRKRTLFRKDINSMALITLLIVCSGLFNIGDSTLWRIFATGIIIAAAGFAFWKFCLDGAERSLILAEGQKNRLVKKMRFQKVREN